MGDDPRALLKDALAGDAATLGALLEEYRHYLAVLARVQIGRQLQRKIDASDIVQEAFLDAHRAFPGFRGDTEGQFLAWLRQILATKLAETVRRYLGTQGRDLRMERDIADGLDKSSMLLSGAFVAEGPSPSQHAARREQAVILADALDQLPPDYREVIVLRNFEELTFPEVARRMERSLDSVEKLWLRALAKLRKVYKADHEHRPDRRSTSA